MKRPPKIWYYKGLGYQLARNYGIAIPINPSLDIETEYINLTIGGWLTIKKGFAWDGPSGPAVDTPSFMRGSLVHDALYWLMRNGYLSEQTYRATADKIMKDINKEAGMGWIRRGYTWLAVRWWSKPSAQPENKRKVYSAP